MTDRELDRERIEEIVDERIEARRSTWSRRAVLAGAAGVAGLGATQLDWIQPASAQSSAAGQIGTPSKPVDIYAYRVGTSSNPVKELYVDQQTTFSATESIDDLTIGTVLTDATGVDHTGELADDGDAQPPQNHGKASHDDTVLVDGTNTGYEIQKDGTDDSGVINFKTQ